MNSRKMTGIYATYIKQFIDLKRNLGFKYLNEEIILSYFDRFTVKTGVSELGVSKELSDDWCAKRPEESDRYRNMRCSVFKLFAEYLNTMRFYKKHELCYQPAEIKDQPHKEKGQNCGCCLQFLF